MSSGDEKTWAGIDEFQLYLYNEGTNFQSYEMLGPHKIDKGWRFAVWARQIPKDFILRVRTDLDII